MKQQRFLELAQQGYNRIPVYEEAIVDLETPLTCYLKLANAPYSYLFESMYGGEKWGRYSFIGLPSKQVIRITEDQLTRHQGEQLLEQVQVTDPFAWLTAYQQTIKLAPTPELPPFQGGLVGYFSYDTVRYIEPKLGPCPNPDPLANPDITLLISDEFIIFDRVRNKLYLVILANPEQDNAWQHAQQRLAQLLDQLYQPLPASPLHNQYQAIELACNQTQAAYFRNVDKIKRYIAAGDMMQTVYSIRLTSPYTAEPTQLYRALRYLNPSPYLYFLNLGDHQIVGSSPEILVRLEDDQVIVRPIAGTRPRGKTLQEDRDLANELLADPKELAEHLMLIDLGRNDIGRICQAGSVTVTEKMSIEHYSHVMHIVSEVQGQLATHANNLDVLKATFPAGTLSGAPKFRAMQVIDELEPIKRGIYGGAVGYLSWQGSMDLAIAIRTAVIKNQTLHIQAGGGIVYDSQPETEWQECMNKANALIKAAQLVAANS